MKKQGFTLIELIIVIAVIALLAAAVFVAVDPAKRIGEAQDAQRWADVTAIADAIEQYVVDNSGTFPTSTASFSSNGTTAYAVTPYGSVSPISTKCQNKTITTTGGMNLGALVGAYLPTIPADPSISTPTTTSEYYFIRNSSGRVTIGACEESDYADASIYVQR